MHTLASGGDIAAAVAKMSSGDILELAPGGSYTLAGGATGFSGLPSGTAALHTRVRGNGATVTGGSQGFYQSGKSFIDVENLTFVDQTINGVYVTLTDDITFTNVSVRSAQFQEFADSWKIVNCDRVTISGGTTGPSTTTYGSTDGVEFWGPCNDCTVTSHTSLGITGGATPDHHGFEVYAGDADDICNNIQFINCRAESLDVGFSCEGGPASVAHVDIQALNCTTATMDNFDCQGVQGSTLYVTAGTLTSRNGNITEL